ncbi:cytochrome b N-terminal domain-containing protein [Hippea alviniae]|uniref:cytochrome b N-terminal domain-containing protein n=1 Tax=Hippea alviniae TaxID=1279027 RepID=UPI0003B2FBF8|nr:cytochrome b N-terminal domain-containing protein [Hippea alviniae]
MKIDYVISWICQALFIVALLSGIPLVFAYYPQHAFESVQKITYLTPFGLFFRKLHYFSSELLLFFIVFHVIIELFLSYKSKRKTESDYLFGSLAFIAVILLMFSGYVLKADQNGQSAALVAQNIMKDSVILKYFSSFLSDSSVFYWKFFLWHVIFLPFFFFLFVFYHAKRVLPRIEFVSIALSLSVIFMLFFKMPKDIPFNLTSKHLTGPWFFEGVENMLKMNVNVDIAVFLGFFPSIALMFYKNESKFKTVINILLILWVIFYVAISLV